MSSWVEAMTMTRYMESRKAVKIVKIEDFSSPSFLSRSSVVHARGKSEEETRSERNTSSLIDYKRTVREGV